MDVTYTVPEDSASIISEQKSIPWDTNRDTNPNKHHSIEHRSSNSAISEYKRRREKKRFLNVLVSFGLFQTMVKAVEKKGFAYHIYLHRIQFPSVFKVWWWKSISVFNQISISIKFSYSNHINRPDQTSRCWSQRKSLHLHFISSVRHRSFGLDMRAFNVLIWVHTGDVLQRYAIRSQPVWEMNIFRAPDWDACQRVARLRLAGENKTTNNCWIAKEIWNWHR